MTAVVQGIRNAELGDLLTILNEQQARKIDAVIPAKDLRFVEGSLVVSRQEMILDEDGFTDPNGTYLPTSRFDDHLAERLDITPGYLRRLRHGKTDARGRLTAESRLDLFDANANGLLHGRKPLLKWPSRATGTGIEYAETPTVIREGVEADARSFLVRLFRGDETGTGVARALLSNRFARMDNIDGLMAMLQGIQDAGIDPSTLKISGDLSESRMYVSVSAPEIATLAPELLSGYRNPLEQPGERARRLTVGLSYGERIEAGRRYAANHADVDVHGMYPAGEEPIVHAGFRLVNSEVGNGRWMVVPEVRILRCSNGMTMTKELFARTHVGGRMEDGMMEFSADTQTKELAFVTAQTRDIVARVLSLDYVEQTVATLTALAGRPVDDPEKTVEVLSNRLKFTKEEQDGILRHFLLSGQLTSGGIAQAVTSYSQTVADADAAFDLDSRAVEAMEMAWSAR